MIYYACYFKMIGDDFMNRAGEFIRNMTGEAAYPDKLEIASLSNYNQPSHPPQLKHPLQSILNEHSSHLLAKWGT